MSSRRAGKLIAGYLVFAALASLALSCLRPQVGDTEVYQTGARRALAGEEIYRSEDDAAFSYPPFMVLLSMPIAPLAGAPARFVWYMINFGLLAAIVVMLCQLVWPAMEAGRSWRNPPLWASFGMSGILAARSVISELVEYQGNDLFVFFFMMLAILAWANGDRARAGAWAGLAAASKATPLLLLPVFLWQRRWRAGLALMAVCIAATLLPDVLVPNRTGGLRVVSWYEEFISKVSISAAPEAEGAWHRWNTLNQSLSGTLHRIFTQIDEPDDVVWNACLFPLAPRGLAALSLAAKLGVVGLLLYCTWPGRLSGLSGRERAFCTLGQGSAVLCGMLLLSPMSSTQHFCFLLAPICFCVADFLHRRRDRLVGAWLAIALVGYSLASKDFIGVTLHRYVQAYGQMTWCALGFMVVSTYVVARRSRESSEPAVVLCIHRDDEQRPRRLAA